MINKKCDIDKQKSLSMSHFLYMLRNRTPILREKVFRIAYASFVSVMPRKSRLFLPLLRNKGAPFSHALRCLSAGNTFPAVRAVFDAVRGGRKRSSALGTTLFILGLEKLRVEQLINGKYSSQKPFAKKRIGNKLRADTFLSVVKQNAVSAIAVAAFPFYKAVDFPALGRRKPL